MNRNPDDRRSGFRAFREPAPPLARSRAPFRDARSAARAPVPSARTPASPLASPRDVFEPDRVNPRLRRRSDRDDDDHRPPRRPRFLVVRGDSPPPSPRRVAGPGFVRPSPRAPDTSSCASSRERFERRGPRRHHVRRHAPRRPPPDVTRTASQQRRWQVARRARPRAMGGVRDDARMRVGDVRIVGFGVGVRSRSRVRRRCGPSLATTRRASLARRGRD